MTNLQNCWLPLLLCATKLSQKELLLGHIIPKQYYLSFDQPNPTIHNFIASQ